MKKNNMNREYYSFFCEQVTGEIRIPEAKEIKKMVDETKEMDKLGRLLIKDTYSALQGAVNNGYEDCEISFFINETSLSKKAIAQVIKAWKDYMKAKGYNPSTFLDDDSEWILSFNWVEKTNK